MKHHPWLFRFPDGRNEICGSGSEIGGAAESQGRTTTGHGDAGSLFQTDALSARSVVCLYYEQSLLEGKIWSTSIGFNGQPWW